MFGIAAVVVVIVVMAVVVCSRMNNIMRRNADGLEVLFDTIIDTGARVCQVMVLFSDV